MADTGIKTKTFKYPFFRGINLRDDENELILGQSPAAQNFELLRRTGLRKKKGFADRFGEFDTSYSFVRATNYKNKDNERFYLSVSYPHLFRQNKDNGFAVTIDNTLTADGEPFFVPLTGNEMLLVDGANAPRLISSTGTASKPSQQTSSQPVQQTGTSAPMQPVQTVGDLGLGANFGKKFLRTGKFGKKAKRKLETAGVDYKQHEVPTSMQQRQDIISSIQGG